MKFIRLAVALLASAFSSHAFAQYTQVQWGINRTGASPFPLAINLSGAWTIVGTVSASGFTASLFPTFSCSASQWVSSGAAGLPVCSQPDASNVSFTQAGTGAIASNVDTKLKSMWLWSFDFTSDNTCAADRTTELQAAINRISDVTAFPDGGKLVLGPGKFCFSTLSITSNNVELEGSNGTFLLKNNATSNGIVVGNGTDVIDNVKLSKFVVGMKTGVIPTGGASIFMRYARNSTIIDVSVGTALLAAQTLQSQSYNSIVVAGYYMVGFDKVNIWGAANDCVSVYGMPNPSSPLVDFGSEFHWTNDSQANVCAHFGAHIAGGAGGVYFESGNISLASYGMYVDKSLDTLATPNPQITIGQFFALDSNTNDGILIESESVGNLFFRGWSSSNDGNGLNVQPTQANGIFDVFEGHMENNGLHGIVSQGGTWTVNGGTFLANGRVAPGGSGIAFAAGTTKAIVTGSRTENNGLGGGSGWGVDDTTAGNIVSISGVSYAGNQSAPWRSINGLAGVGWPGVSGAIPYWSDANTVKSSAALAADMPVIGGGAGVAPSTGTRSGNTTQFVTTTGTQTSGDCVKIDANGNHIANGSACPTAAATAANVQAGTSSTTYVTPSALSGSAAPQTLTDGATINWDMASGYNAKVTLGGNRTMAAPTNVIVGITYSLDVIQDGTGSRTVTWNAAFNWGTAGTPTLTTTASKIDTVSCKAYATNNLFCNINKGF